MSTSPPIDSPTNKYKQCCCEELSKPINENWILTPLYVVVTLTYLCVVRISDLRNDKSAILFGFAFWQIIPGSILIFDTLRNKEYKAGIAFYFGAIGDYLLEMEDYDGFSSTASNIIFYGGIGAFTIQNSIFLSYYYGYIHKEIWWVYVIYYTVYLIGLIVLFTVLKMYQRPIVAMFATIYGIIVYLGAVWSVLTHNKLSGIGFTLHAICDTMIIFEMFTTGGEIAHAVTSVIHMVLYWIGIYCIAAGAIQLLQNHHQATKDNTQIETEMHQRAN